MDRKRLGKTNLEIPRVVFGATSLGNLFRALNDAEKSAIVGQWMRCVEPPVVIDSAGKYGAGLSLEVIGRELAASKVAPSQVIISNKLAWRRVPLTTPQPTFEPDAWIDLKHDAVQDISYDGILRCWEEGNQLLNGYTAQLVSVHDPDEYLAAAKHPDDRKRRLEDIVGAYRALAELKAAGQVAGVGLGAKNWRIIAELDRLCELEWVMIANSFTIMHHPPELLEFVDSLGKRDVGIINSALFHGGFLTGGDFFDYRKLNPSDRNDAARIRWREKFQATCRELDVDPFHVGVAFGLSHPAVTAVALSSGQASRVETHVGAVEKPIAAEVWSHLKSAGLISYHYP